MIFLITTTFLLDTNRIISEYFNQTLLNVFRYRPRVPHYYCQIAVESTTALIGGE